MLHTLNIHFIARHTVNRLKTNKKPKIFCRMPFVYTVIEIHNVLTVPSRYYFCAE